MTHTLDEILNMLEGRMLPDPTPDGVPCCDSSAYWGPEHCTCWQRVHDQDQNKPEEDVAPLTAQTMCADCAFRPASPERRDSEHAVCSSGDLMRLAKPTNQERFFCHRGMRAIVGHYHPSASIYAPYAPVDAVVAYDPPIINNIAYQADGSPALLCAGLAAARRAKDWTP